MDRRFHVFVWLFRYVDGFYLGNRFWKRIVCVYRNTSTSWRIKVILTFPFFYQLLLCLLSASSTFLSLFSCFFRCFLFRIIYFFSLILFRFIIFFRTRVFLPLLFIRFSRFFCFSFLTHTYFTYRNTNLCRGGHVLKPRPHAY